jgi:hypothetical protein
MMTSAPSGHGSAQSEHAADEAHDNNPNHRVPKHVRYAQALYAYQIHPLGFYNHSESGPARTLCVLKRRHLTAAPSQTVTSYRLTLNRGKRLELAPKPLPQCTADVR